MELKIGMKVIYTYKNSEFFKKGEILTVKTIEKTRLGDWIKFKETRWGTTLKNIKILSNKIKKL